MALCEIGHANKFLTSLSCFRQRQDPPRQCNVICTIAAQVDKNAPIPHKDLLQRWFKDVIIIKQVKITERTFSLIKNALSGNEEEARQVVYKFENQQIKILENA